MPLLHQSVAIVFVGALAFGLYLATLLACLRWLLLADEGWKFRKHIRWGIVMIAFGIFACNVIYLSSALHSTMLRAFHAITDPPGSTYQVPQWKGVFSCTAATCNVLLADIVLIYRCWVIYGRRYQVIIFPCALWLGALVCSILQVYLQVAHITNPSIGPYTWASVTMTLGPGIVLIPFWGSTLVLNAYSSAALIRRIYGAAKECQAINTSVQHLHLAISIIAESGLLQLSITLAHFLVWFGKDSFAVNVISILNAPIIGIAFNWFLIRFQTSKSSNTTINHAPNISSIKFTSNAHTTYQDSTATPETTSTGTTYLVIGTASNPGAAGADQRESFGSRGVL